MTCHTSFGDTIETPEEFHQTLRELLLTAHANGIEVAGGWECRSGGSAPDWEAVVTVLDERRDAGPPDEA